MTRVLIVPGLNGHPGFLLRTAPRLFPDWGALGVDHSRDVATDGVDGLARRALAVLDADPDDHGPTLVCGESFGGTVALTLARDFPERVSGLLLFSTFGWYPSRLARRATGAITAWSHLELRFGRPFQQPMYRATRIVSVPAQLGLGFPPGLLNEYLLRPPSHMPAYRRKLELSMEFDARPWLPTLEVPTFILIGTWDPVVPIAAGRELARLIPGAELHQLPGGHLVHAVRAGQVAELISAWAQANALA
jgi:pimeloyl-ACP methyl ester carboxylesterase